MKRYFLGMAARYTTAEVWKHTCAVGRKRDCKELQAYLGKRYGGEAILCKNGRTALALALKAYFNRGDAIIVNGFTCYAVYEAIRAAGLTPVWADISEKDLNYNLEALETAWAGDRLERDAAERPKAQTAGGKNLAGAAQIRGIIIQNSLGNPVDIAAVEKFAHKHGLMIVEDLAHCAGVRYADGREVGTVGVAAAFSFGKDKSIDTTSGGAVVLRQAPLHTVQAPVKLPKPSDHLRARFYPMFGAMCRGLTSVHLGGVFMRCLVGLHWVEKSADNKLDIERRPSKFEAKLALQQFKRLKKSGEPPLREFYLVEDRGVVLTELKRAGYYFDGLWYERPVSPARYYKRVKFPEAECPVATRVADEIINFPTYYSKRQLARARKIVEAHLAQEEK